MTCPLYSVFHVVLSTQSLPACRETLNHTSLGAVALTAPRSLLDFTFRKRAATCARESAAALRWAHCSGFCQDVPREVNQYFTVGKRRSADHATGARSHALTTSACSWRNISTVRQTNSVPNTSASTLPTCAARSSMCPSGSLLDDALSGNETRRRFRLQFPAARTRRRDGTGTAAY